MQTILLIAFGIVAILLVVILAKLSRKPSEQKTDGLLLLEQRIENLSKSLVDQLHIVTNQVNDRLKESTESMDRRLKESTGVVQDSNKIVGERLDNASRVVGDVNRRLGELGEASKQIFMVGKDISSLQEILRAPKLRGGLGELFLGDLLAQIMPPAHYVLQYAFKSNEKVDAVIKLRDEKLVPVDAKFPLENFRRMVDATEDAERATHRKQFLNDVKKHIDKIAKLYILPAENTLDFAFMYIPAENVYYETIIKGNDEASLMHYAYDRRVIPISPNTFYVYMQTIIMGLRGMQVEKSASQMIKNLQGLSVDLGKFETHFELIGKHLGNARNSYDAGEKRLEHFKDQLAVVAPQDVAVAVSELPISKPPEALL